MRQPSDSAWIAPAGGLDAPMIAGLHAETVGDGPWDEGALRHLLESGDGFARVATGRAYGESMPLGFAFARVIADEAELLGIGVLPAARGRGLGGRLLADVLATAGQRGARRIVLEVCHENAAAHRLYTAAGFTRVGTRPGYYATRDGAPADAEVLARALA